MAKGSNTPQLESLYDECFAAISDKAVPVVDFEYIPDVYEAILSYADSGKFIYEHYEDLPEQRHDKIREWVLKWIKDGNYWKEAKIIYDMEGAK